MTKKQYSLRYVSLRRRSRLFCFLVMFQDLLNHNWVSRIKRVKNKNQQRNKSKSIINYYLIGNLRFKTSFFTLTSLLTIKESTLDFNQRKRWKLRVSNHFAKKTDTMRIWILFLSFNFWISSEKRIKIEIILMMKEVFLFPLRY